MIARVFLGAAHSEPPLGSISLKPHQTSSITRLESALNEFGGALLCDEVGMGKTFVALAIARRHPLRLIIAPAALKKMWGDALAQAEVDADLITFEWLSRNEPPRFSPDLLIIDEAHHVRNPTTLRYARISRLARSSRVLLLTATPVHNRRTDLIALLSLFLGSRAGSLTERELSQCVVRRERSDTDVAGIPDVLPVLGYDIPDCPGLVNHLMSLPPPLPPRDGEPGGVLINRGLVHQWSSSHAALRDALLRRLAKATALIASLELGRYPSAAELESWTFAEGALQLGFAELLSPPTCDAAELLRSVSAHAKGIEVLLRDYGGVSSMDDARAHALADIRSRNPGAKIVAFAQYSSTVSALYRRIARNGGAAVLTATGARVAGGKLSRDDAIARFAPLANAAPSPPPAESIELLLATDLLSEGVNLQDAEVVVHLDVPWTAARMEQRVGRVARMGSRHRHVKVYQFRPPASAEKVQHGEALVSLKFDMAHRLVGAGRFSPLAEDAGQTLFRSSLPSHVEELRTILGRWLDMDSKSSVNDGHLRVGAVAAGQTGFIAAGRFGGAPVLLTCLSGILSMDLEAQIASCRVAAGPNSLAADGDYEAALRVVHDWAEHQQASEYAGAATSAPTRRQRLLRRIDAAMQRAPPHLRASRARAVAVARQIASSPHGVAVEEALEELAASTLPDAEWLSALAAVVPPGKPSRTDRQDFRLFALLLFKP